jgi:hypothetical protein
MGKLVSKYALPGDQIRVYKHDQLPGLGTIPHGHISREEATFIVSQLGFATWCVKGFAIHMKPDSGRKLKKFIEIVIRGNSAQMGPRIIEGAADGIPYFVSLVEGWAPMMRATP